jgi:hypothetical protein
MMDEDELAEIKHRVDRAFDRIIEVAEHEIQELTTIAVQSVQELAAIIAQAHEQHINALDRAIERLGGPPHTDKWLH